MIDFSNLSNLDLSSLAASSSTPPFFVNPDAAIEINLQSGAIFISRLNAGVGQMECICRHSVKSFSKNQEPSSSAPADRYAKRLCRLIKTIKFLTNVTGYLSTWISEANKFLGWIVSQITEKIIDITAGIVQYILGRIEIVILKIKQLVLFIKIKIAKFLRKILFGINDKKGSAASAAISAAVQGVVVAFQALAKVAYFILLGIDILLKMLPPILMTNGQCMAFFYTPKSIMLGMTKIDINAVNANFSIIDRLPMVLCTALATFFDEIPKINAALKYSIIAAGAAAGIATAMPGVDFNIPPTICKALQVLDPKKIIEAIDKILKAFAMPYPLPKYEELSPITIGYLSFLITGFCPAGQSAFGFPNCP